MTVNGKAKDLLDRLQRGESIDLLELEEQEGPEVVLPNRRKVRVRLFDGEHYQLFERMQRDGANPDANLAQLDADAERLVRFAIPDLTGEELRSLSPFMGWFIGKAAARQAEAMLWNLRKNAERPVPPQPAPAAASPPQRSTRKTKPSTPSRASRKRSEAAGGP
jgi:hypothetical protein